MVKFLISVASYLIANAAGLFAATLLLPGFSIDFTSFIMAVLIFSVFQTLAGPMITKLSLQHVPQLRGGVAIIVIMAGLFVTNLFMAGMEIGGIANLLAATLLVWIGSLIAAILLPIYVFKEVKENRKERQEKMESDVQSAVDAAQRSAEAAEAAAKAAQEAVAPAQPAPTPAQTNTSKAEPKTTEAAPKTVS